MHNEWQSIDTAPRDGTRVLLRYEFRNRIVCGNWDLDQYVQNPRPYWAHDQMHFMGKSDARNSPPTHWQPLVGP